MTNKKIIWMPHAGHFCLSNHCRFFLNTYVNGYIVSTVGEYVPDSDIRRISRGIRKWPLNLEGNAEESDFIKRTVIMKNGEMVGYGEDIGSGRKYETMVFKARKSKHKCCPYSAEVTKEFDMEGYNTAEDACKGHMKLVEKYTNL